MKTRVLTYTGTLSDLNNYLIGREVLGVQLTGNGTGHVDHYGYTWLITVREKAK